MTFASEGRRETAENPRHLTIGHSVQYMMRNDWATEGR